jgi:hypothetical protein
VLRYVHPPVKRKYSAMLQHDEILRAAEKAARLNREEDQIEG